jgi:heptosyltransferase-2
MATEQRDPALSEQTENLPSHTDIRRILVIKWSALGDIVLSTAMMEDIRRAFPEAEIDLNTLPPWDRLLFEGDPRFRRVFTVDLRGKERGWRGVRRWLREVRRGRYDLIVDLQSNDRSRLMLTLAYLTGGAARWRLGTHRRFPYNVAPGPQPRAVYAFDHLRAALQAGGIPTLSPRPVLHISEEHRRHATELMERHGLVPGNYAAFIPGSQAGGHLKRWGVERYRALAQRLRADGISRVALIGGPDDLDECERIAADDDAIVNLCGQTHVTEIVPLAEGARFLVANDTGPAHISAASGRPMVVICGPTDPRRIKPPGDNVVTLQADLPCINCYLKECSHHSCMAMITPELVQETLRPLVER